MLVSNQGAFNGESRAEIVSFSAKRLSWCEVSYTKCIGCLSNCIDPIPTSLASLHPRSLGTGLTATPLIERVGMKISHGAVPAFSLSNSLRNWRSRPLAWLFPFCIQSRQERYVVIRSGYIIGLWRNIKKEDQFRLCESSIFTAGNALRRALLSPLNQSNVEISRYEIHSQILCSSV